MILSILVAVAVLVFPQQSHGARDVQVDKLNLAPTASPETSSQLPVYSTVPPAQTSHAQQCRCVPYYMCSGFNRTVHVVNSEATGWGKLDTRLEKDKCQESVEVCCRNVMQPSDVPRLATHVASSCGRRNPLGVDPYIRSNGNDAEYGEFPWVVAILHERSREYGGAGVLVHPQVVMTAAHIASKFEKITVRAGEWDTQTTKERLLSQERVVDEIILNPDFHPKKLTNDIALLHLKTPFEIDAHINTLCLPEQNEVFDSSKNCYANGWGKDIFGEKGRYAAILKKVDLNMVPSSICNDLLRNTRLGARFILHESLICAGGEEGKDTCQGDGGGPLACPTSDGRYKLTGLVAWGISCGESSVPAVYVRVSMFMSWVNEVMASWGLSH